MYKRIKVKAIQRFEFESRRYFPGDISYQIERVAKRWVSRGIAKYIDAEEVIENEYYMQDKVSIIILVKDALDYVKKCLESINAHTYNYELIIVDNGSKNKTREYLNNLDWLDFTLITNKKNKGFSYGNNQAIKIAKCDYICFLNSDTVVTPNWLPKLLKCFEIKNNCGIVSSTTSWSGEEQCDKSLMAKRLDMTKQDILQYANQLKDGYKISTISGFCMLTKKSILDKVGVFDYRRYGIGNVDEKDLMWRMEQFGYKTYWAKGAYVHHYGHQTFKEMGVDPFDNLFINRATLEERKKDPNLFIENDTLIKNIKKIKAKKSKKIDVIIPVLDREEETIKTINSLLSNNKNINLIIIDNNSDDLRYLYKFDLKIIKNKKNKGIVKALNQGLDISKSKYIVFMHNDIVVNTKNWIDKAIKFMEKNKDVGIVGLAGWKKLEKNAIYNRNYLITAIDKYNKKPDGEFEEVVILDGCCNVIRNIGLRFDDIYGLIHFHDFDFSMQYRKKGYRLFVMNGNAIHFAEQRKRSTIESKKYKNLIKKREKDYWNERRNIFIEKWKNHLSVELEPIPILMITWDRLEYTKKAIKSIKENTYYPYILWIWDNGSKDGTVEYLKSIETDNIFINLKDRNYGLVPPMNEFFDKFKNSRYVSKVDNDTIVPDYWLTKLKNVMDNVSLFVIQADHYLGLPYKLNNNQQFYNELELIKYRDEKIYLFPHASGTGVLIRRKYIDKPIKIIKGKLSGWVDYQFKKCKTENLRCAFYTGVWVDRLDFIGTNKVRIDYPEYNKKINKMRSGNEKNTGFGYKDIDLENLKRNREIMRIPWGK